MNLPPRIRWSDTRRTSTGRTYLDTRLRVTSAGAAFCAAVGLPGKCFCKCRPAATASRPCNDAPHQPKALSRTGGTGPEGVVGSIDADAHDQELKPDWGGWCVTARLRRRPGPCRQAARRRQRTGTGASGVSRLRGCRSSNRDPAAPSPHRRGGVRNADSTRTGARW